MTPDRIGIVVIGRNEGERLKTCLRSVKDAGSVIYVDSGSTDGSQEFADSLGVEVVRLAVPPNFTAARARNEGVARLLTSHPDVAFIQTLDGDCEMDARWLAAASSALASDERLGAVLGRLRERYPDRSIYNAMCDHEWEGVPGDAPGFGGIAMIRASAIEGVGGYLPRMIAGEDTEMAMRLRKGGWAIRRLDADMALHDADITRFGQWWRRARRGGHGFAEMAHLHPDARWPNWPRKCRSIIAWGAVGPALLLTTLALALIAPAWLLASLVIVGLYAAQTLRIMRAKRRHGLPPRRALLFGGLLVLGNFPEVIGLAQFHLNRLAKRHSAIIEYKLPQS